MALTYTDIEDEVYQGIVTVPDSLIQYGKYLPGMVFDTPGKRILVDLCVYGDLYNYRFISYAIDSSGHVDLKSGKKIDGDLPEKIMKLASVYYVSAKNAFDELPEAIRESVRKR